DKIQAAWRSCKESLPEDEAGWDSAVLNTFLNPLLGDKAILGFKHIPTTHAYIFLLSLKKGNFEEVALLSFGEKDIVSVHLTLSDIKQLLEFSTTDPDANNVWEKHRDHLNAAMINGINKTGIHTSAVGEETIFSGLKLDELQASLNKGSEANLEVLLGRALAAGIDKEQGGLIITPTAAVILGAGDVHRLLLVQIIEDGKMRLEPIAVLKVPAGTSVKALANLKETGLLKGIIEDAEGEAKRIWSIYAKQVGYDPATDTQAAEKTSLKSTKDVDFYASLMRNKDIKSILIRSTETEPGTFNKEIAAGMADYAFANFVATLPVKDGYPWRILLAHNTVKSSDTVRLTPFVLIHEHSGYVVKKIDSMNHPEMLIELLKRVVPPQNSRYAYVTALEKQYAADAAAKASSAGTATITIGDYEFVTEEDPLFVTPRRISYLTQPLTDRDLHMYVERMLDGKQPYLEGNTSHGLSYRYVLVNSQARLTDADSRGNQAWLMMIKQYGPSRLLLVRCLDHIQAQIEYGEFLSKETLKMGHFYIIATLVDEKESEEAVSRLISRQPAGGSTRAMFEQFVAAKAGKPSSAGKSSPDRLTGKGIEKLREAGQSIWFDGALSEEEFGAYRAKGVTGQTTNLTIINNAIKDGMFDDQITQGISEDKTPEQIYDSICIEYIRGMAEKWRPVYDETGGKDGFVSIEVNPDYAHASRKTIDEAVRLVNTIEMPNVMVKVPATRAGIRAIEELTYLGINVNVTLLFSVDMYKQAAEAYLRGLERRVADGSSLGSIHSVASFFVSRVNCKPGACDERIRKTIDRLKRRGDTQGAEILSGLLGKAAIANSIVAYEVFKDLFNSDRFQQLQKAGANIQRPLWASTQKKDDEVDIDGTPYPVLIYVSTLPFRDTVNTVPQQTLDHVIASDDPTQPDSRYAMDAEEADAVMKTMGKHGIDINAVTREQLRVGIKSFAKDYRESLGFIRDYIGNITPKPSSAGDVDAIGVVLDEFLQTPVAGLQEHMIGLLEAGLRHAREEDSVIKYDDVEELLAETEEAVKLANATKNIDVNATVMFNDEDLSEQQKASIAFLKKGLPALQALEDLLGITIRLKSDFDKDADLAEGSELIIISPQPLQEYPNAKYLLFNQAADMKDSYIPAIPMAVMAKGLLVLKNPTEQTGLVEALKDLSRQITKRVLVDDIIQNYLDHGVLTIELPTPKKYDKERLEKLQRVALYTLIAA
ncbi:transaldolase family protein, partial [Candidatus Omnitrophota bacterium]